MVSHNIHNFHIIAPKAQFTTINKETGQFWLECQITRQPKQYLENKKNEEREELFNRFPAQPTKNKWFKTLGNIGQIWGRMLMAHFLGLMDS